jgi:hypothetical protein
VPCGPRHCGQSPAAADVVTASKSTIEETKRGIESFSKVSQQKSTSTVGRKSFNRNANGSC